MLRIDNNSEGGNYKLRIESYPGAHFIFSEWVKSCRYGFFSYICNDNRIAHWIANGCKPMDTIQYMTFYQHINAQNV